MARKVEEVLFVTDYGKVSRKILAKTLLESLDETGARILGVVLNDLPQKKSQVIIIRILWLWVLQI